MKERFSIICASYLLLFKDQKVLLLRRYNTGYEDGKYSLPAGHIEKDETALGCLIRETKEEIDISINKDSVILSHVMHRKAADKNEERLDFFFTVQDWSGDPKICEKDKCDDLSWFDLDALPDNIIPYIKKAIQSVINGVRYSEMNK